MTTAEPHPLDDVPLEQLVDQLREKDPARRLEAVQALARRRGRNIVTLLSSTCRGDTSPEVRRRAEEARAIIAEDTALFGPGEKLRLTLPAPIPTLEEERRSSRYIWGMWIGGAILTVNAMLIQEHTELKWSPIFGVVVIMVVVVFASSRLVQPKNSPGSLVLDPERQALVFERLPSGETVYPASSLKGFRVERREIPTPEDEPTRVTHEVILELPDGITLVAVRRDTADDIQRAAERLRFHLRVISAPV